MVALLILGRTTQAQTNQAELADLPIEKLLDLEVTSVSKKSEKLSGSAAAIFVLTQDDIRRSGAMSIPEALRLVPGLDVAQVDSQQWAISARGFNDVFANKLLVMQDGRSLYTPLFSGVFWDVQNTLMEDIERIEVIRGPGASLWGANAVNGVINIITKSAKDTQGVLATAGGGNYEQGFAGARYGGKLADDVYFRIYGQYFNRGDTASRSGPDVQDSWQQGEGGFRIDWDASTQNLLTFQGDIYSSSLNQVFNTFDPTSPTFSRVVPDDVRDGGGNILGRWSHIFSDSSDLKLQAYYDRADRDTVIFKKRQDAYDIDFQHHFVLGERHDFVWGLGYRLTVDQVANSGTVAFNPDDMHERLFNAFVQDEITLVEKRLRLTLGARLEHNNFTGVEVQPNARLAWTPDERQTIWGAVSRAVRTPSEAEEFISLNRVIPPGALGPGNPPAPTPASIYGNQNFESEVLTAYEIGYRVRPYATLSLDFTAFYNVYDDLRSQEFGPSATQPASPFSVPFNVQNQLHGETYGVEAAPTWQVCDWWRLQPAYSLLKMHLVKDAGSTDPNPVSSIEGQSPQQQVSLRSSMDFPQNISFDWTLRYVDRLPAFNINSYVAVDVRLGWRPTKNLEFAVVGQNLGSSQHAEFSPTFIGTPQSDIRPSVYGKVTWRF